jgi:4-amino-4-deoxy-L-arabinose transferase-like glycosyltransferase
MNRLLGAALLLSVLFVYFHRLGEGSLVPWDESLTAERSREMAETGMRLTPQFGYRPDFHKPPLYYWITAALFGITGPTEGSVRVPSVLFAFGALAMVFLIARDASGSVRCGLLCAALLALNPHWVNRTREGLLDSGLVFGALTAFWALTQPWRAWARATVAGIGLGLAALLKTPLVAASLALPFFELAVIRKGRAGRVLLGAAAVFAAVCGWWYVAVLARWGHAFWDTFMVYSTWTRMTSQVEGHPGQFSYYIDHVARQAPMLGTLLVGAAIVALRRPRKYRRYATLLLAACAGLALLTAMGSKRDTYLILVYPFMALAAGTVLYEAAGSWPARARAIGAVLLLAAAGVGFADGYRPVIDGSPGMKQACVRIRELASTNDVIVTAEPELGDIMFYTHRPAHFVGLRSLEELGLEVSAARGSLILIGEERTLDRVRDEVTARTAFDEEKGLFVEGRYHVLRRSRAQATLSERNQE